MIINPNSCFVDCFLILADILSECLSSCLTALRSGILTGCWPNLGEVKITEVRMKLANTHLSTATVELPCALRMGEEALTEAAQLYGGLSDAETCGDLDDNEGEWKRLPHCGRYAEGLWWGLLVNSKFQTDKWTHHNQEPCFRGHSINKIMKTCIYSYFHFLFVFTSLH